MEGAKLDINEFGHHDGPIIPRRKSTMVVDINNNLSAKYAY